MISEINRRSYLSKNTDINIMSRKKEMSDEEFKRLWAETGGSNYAGEGDSPYDQEFLDSWRGKEFKKKRK